MNTPLGLRIVIWGSLSLFPLFGIFCWFLGLRNVANAWDSRYWQPAQGRVLAADIQRDTSSSGSTTGAKITVAYAVGGREYQTSNLWFGRTEGSGDSSEAELHRLRYAPGRVLPVFYNPRDPSEAVVHRGLHMDLLWLLGAGLAFFLPGVMFAMLYQASESGRSMKHGVVLFGVIFMILGGVLLLLGASNVYHAFLSREWPTAEGVITVANEDSSTSVTKDEDGNTERTTTYSTALVYKYELNGQTYFNNQRRFGQLAGSSAEWAAEIAEKYPPGKKVAVAYSPGDPELSVLEPGFHDELKWVPGAGAAFFLFGLIVAYFTARSTDGLGPLAKVPDEVAAKSSRRGRKAAR
jgi:hypothetical protein